MDSQITSNLAICSTALLTYTKETHQSIKALHYWPFAREAAGDGIFPSLRTSNMENVSMSLHLHDIYFNDYGNNVMLENVSGSYESYWRIHHWFKVAPSHCLIRSWPIHIMQFGSTWCVKLFWHMDVEILYVPEYWEFFRKEMILSCSLTMLHFILCLNAHCYNINVCSC